MEATDTIQDKNYLRTISDLFLIIVVSGVLLCTMMMLLPFQSQFEANNFKIILNMLQSQHWLLPDVSTNNISATPPLYYWIALGVSKIFGNGYLVFRGISVVCALMNLCLLYLTLQRIFTRSIAVIGCVILSSSLLFFGSAVFVGAAQFTFLLFSAVIYSILFLCVTEDKQVKRVSLYYWFLLSLLALTAGYYAVILVFATVGIWLAMMKNNLLTKRFHSYLGYLIFLAISLPWFIYAGRHTSGFWHGFFIIQLMQTYNAFAANNFIPYWQHILGLLLAFMPWTIFLVNGLWYNAPASWQARQTETIGIFLMLQCLLFALVLLFVKLDPVWSIVPFAALAVICARYLAPGLELKRMPLQRSAYDILFIVFVVAFSYGLTHLMFVINKGDMHSIKFFQFLVGYLVLAAVISLPILRFTSIKKAIITLTVLSFITYLGGSVFIKLTASDQQLLTALSPDGTHSFIVMTEFENAKNLFSR